MSVKKGKKRWIVVGVVALVVVALVIGVASIGSQSKPAATSQGTVEFITKRNIANSITGNGVIEASNSEDVTGGSYGMKVESVNVEVGQIVNEGDIICKFDTSDIDEQIADLQTRINDTEADRKEQNAKYDERIADADADRKEQIAELQEDIATAQLELANAEKKLVDLTAKRAEYIANGFLDYSEEVRAIDDDIDDVEDDIERIKTRIDSYESQITSLENEDNSSVEDSKRNYNDQVDSTVKSLKDQIKRYKDQKEDAVIVAGMSGTITAVNVVEGSSFSGGTIATIEGVDHFIVEAQIEEYDIPDIAVGMKVLIKTDATRDAELEGVVTYVAPRATNSGNSMAGLSGFMNGVDTSSFSSGSGSATYLVKIELKEQNSRLRLGMNARTSIITEEKVDVWSVPYDAIYTREDGTTYLEQVTGKDEEGNLITKELDVEVGIQGTYYIEVISSLINEQTQILIPDAKGNSSIEELLNMMGGTAGI